jgi:hypothetical protein
MSFGFLILIDWDKPLFSRHGSSLEKVLARRQQINPEDSLTEPNQRSNPLSVELNRFQKMQQ